MQNQFSIVLTKEVNVLLEEYMQNKKDSRNKIINTLLLQALTSSNDKQNEDITYIKKGIKKIYSLLQNNKDISE